MNEEGQSEEQSKSKIGSFPMQTDATDAGSVLEEMKTHKSGYEIASLVLGIISFIPLVGVLLGILAIIFGLIALKKIKSGEIGGGRFAKLGIVLGVLGVIFSFILYGSLFYFGFVKKDGPFGGMRVRVTQQALTQNVGALELYKKKLGKYPESLEIATKEGFTIFPTDHYLNPLYYQVSEDGQSYEMSSLGPDGEYGTEDDISLAE